MFGPHLFHILMTLTTMLFLLTITQSIYGFIRYVRNEMFIKPLSPLSNFFKTISPLPLKHFTHIMGRIFNPSILSRDQWYTHLTTPPYNPEHNGYSESQHRHIVETGPILLHQASIPLTFLSYAFATAVYLINRMPKVGLSLGSSFENLFNKAHDPSKLHVFGCLCFP